MKHIKKFISIALCIAIVICSAAFMTNASPRQARNKYPFVFVHGLNGWGGNEGINDAIPYWGATTGNLMDYLQNEGYDCYSASVGPISSAWDRACELYAQLMGTTVDYGAAHSAANGHRRYGRTYTTPLFEGWGKTDSKGNIQKIHLIGHSFGGTTIRVLAHLLTYGCPEEKAATKDGSLSGLFTGGKEKWVESVTTICTPHNEATMYYFTRETGLWEGLFLGDALYTSTLGRSPLNGRAVDFHLEQFGMTNTPGKYDADGYIKAIINFLENSQDTCQYDLSPEGNKKLNKMIKTSPNIYYFSYAFSSSQKSKVTGITWPIPTTNPLIAPLGTWIGHHRPFKDEKADIYYDESWQDNDALCNTKSELYPFDEPHKNFDGNIRRGIWNVMPIEQGDHGTAIGLLGDADTVHAFYNKLVEMLNKLK